MTSIQIDYVRLEDFTNYVTMETYLIVNFSIQHVPQLFQVDLKKENDTWVPAELQHNMVYMVEHHPQTLCPLCGAFNLICNELENKRAQLLEQILQHPAIRLRLLTR